MSFTKEDFEDRIDEIISEKEWTTSNVDLIEFNWKNALRALPLIFAKQDFSAVDEKKFQEKLYFIFNRIDRIIFSKYNYNLLGKEHSSLRNSTVRSNLLSFELEDRRNNFQFHDIFFFTPILNPEDYIVRKEFVWDGNKPFYKTILAVEEILDIEKANKLLQVALTEIGLLNEPGNFGDKDYGEIWDAFLNMLSENGCDYWAKFYERIFKNNFVLTVEDINEIRIRVELSKILFSPDIDKNFKHCPNQRLANNVALKMTNFLNYNVNEEGFLNDLKNENNKEVLNDKTRSSSRQSFHYR